VILLKISLGIYYLSNLVEKWQRRAVYVVVGTATLCQVAYFFYAAFQCGTPNSHGASLWFKELTNQCATSPHSATRTGFFFAIYNMLTNIALVFIPIPALRNAKVTHVQKMIITGILGVGFW
jgi:hypothetical protein